MTPARWSCRSRVVSSVLDSPGAPFAISVKVLEPFRTLRRMIGVQRSAKTSDALAIGQYWP